jgi:multidrug efflux pump subunit AcrB
MFDQSIFVRAAIDGVVHEALIAAGLTGLMILMFLGSWRSTLIVALSIPLSILCSIIALSALGQTMNVMTLGGLALAVGVLVDDATVGIENIHRHMGHGKTIEEAILEGAQQIAVPTLVSTLAICIVFVPVFFLAGAAGSLFKPLAMAVVFALLASYVISRTLVPTLVRYALEYEERHQGAPGPIERVHLRFDAAFERMRERYRGVLARALARRGRVAGWFAVGTLASCLLIPFLGQNFFPSVDAGQVRLHLRAPAGTRVEETERLVAAVERTIRQVIPPSELKTILDNVGMTGAGGSNLAFSDNPTIGSGDADILISLTEDREGSVDDYRRALRRRLRDEFPQLVVFFQAADIVGQILNFGLPAPIDVQVVGANKKANYAIARDLEARMRRIPGAVDVRVHQVVNAPELFFTVDRDRATALALTERDVASNVLVSLASSGQTAPNFWLNPQNGVNYSILVQTPQRQLNSVNQLENTPVVPSGANVSVEDTQLLGNLATVDRGVTPTNASHYNLAPAYDVLLGVQGTDLGSVADRVRGVIAKYSKDLPRGTTINLRGQVESMDASFKGLSLGLVFAVVLVYLLMVINFQSWIDPLIILMALPGAMAGILWMLFATGTTISVPALMGAIMSIGVATANSILMITFANEQREEAKLNAHDAALTAGLTRLRPVIMTALAMIIGMLPMSLGLGEGGEQNAPLGRAVIGGLSFATFATLFFVPVVYSALRKTAPETHVEPELM